MTRTIYLILLLSVLFLSSCSLSKNVKTDPTQGKTVNKPKVETSINKAGNTLATPRKLYQKKQYDQALMSILGADSKLLENPSARKLLRNINDRLVTVQWYLQKSIIELLKGNKKKARYHLDEGLKLYPAHKPSLLLKKRMASISLDKNKPLKKYQSGRITAVKKDLPARAFESKAPTKEDLDLAGFYLAEGNTYFDEGKFDLAKASWLQGHGVAPSHAALKDNLVKLCTNEGLQLFGQGNIDASIKTWEEGLKIKPNDPAIKGYLDKARKAEAKVRSIN
jgi:tetratricopeptide (TPR) repeat protein